MLTELKIENLALIESLHLELEQENSSGLVVMTGETGAGKSIMLRAIHLLTGGRASMDWIRSGAESCVVESLFEINPANSDFLSRIEEQGLGDDPTIIIKRIISRKGRSRLYINGSLATAKMAAELTDSLLNVASQHDHQQLLQPAFHLDFLDTLGELWPVRKDFAKLFQHYIEQKAELDELKSRERDKEQRRDFLRFQLEEIHMTDPQPGEDEQLDSERKRLKSAGTLIRLSRRSYTLFSSSLIDGLVQIRKDMASVAELDGDAEELAAAITDYSFQAEDLVGELRDYRDGLENDPGRLETVNERLAELQHIKRKYGENLEQVLEFASRAEKELQQLDNMEEELQSLEQSVSELQVRLEKEADKLTSKRRETAAALEEAMERELHSLAFNHSGLTVHFERAGQGAEQIRASGRDRVEFFFSANPGEPPRPLVKVASGGELSRLMLAFKCLLARKDMVETVIFDEVDAGIGGEAAEAVARKIQELASHHQVFCITHLPQIAARGTEHYRVEKKMENGRTQSSIKQLSKEERIEELSRMLAGESPTKQTRAWAEELLAKGDV